MTVTTWTHIVDLGDAFSAHAPGDTHGTKFDLLSPPKLRGPSGNDYLQRSIPPMAFVLSNGVGCQYTSPVMNPGLFYWQYFPRFARFGVLSVVFFLNSFMPAAATGLLVRWSEGGPDRYTGVFGPIAIGFTVEEATRIESVRTWIWRDGPVTASLLSNDLSGKLYSETFDSQPALSAPARWQGVGSLRWDLQPGAYYLSFDEGFFPLGYPVVRPNPPGVQIPFDFEVRFDDRWESTGFPFGVEIYGRQLSAVPEPAAYGLVASATLLGLAAFRRRRGRFKT